LGHANSGDRLIQRTESEASVKRLDGAFNPIAQLHKDWDHRFSAAKARIVQKYFFAWGDEQRHCRIAEGKKHFRDCNCKEAVDQEVEPFEHVADDGGNDHAG